MRFITVDDEPYALRDTAQAIHDARPDVELHEFITPTEAVEYAAENIVDVAFLDIEMGSMNGLELAKKLKDIYGKTNIVFVTGFSEYALEAFSLFASGYILKPVSASAIADVLAHLRDPIGVSENGKLRVQTFGKFEVFMDSKPLYFPRKKSKELFAYLIHRRGAGCSSKEIASILFENQPYGISMQKQVQTVMSVMMKTLTDAGVRDVVIKNFNSTSIDISKINCDYYRFMEYDLSAINTYTGEYMSDYDWAEFTIGYLDNIIVRGE